jgi:hypothetical protein
MTEGPETGRERSSSFRMIEVEVVMLKLWKGNEIIVATWRVTLLPEWD